MAEPRSVFITGANGFIGRRLAEHYRERGAEVRGVDVIPADGVVGGDVTMPGQWQEHARGSDLVIHTAAVLTLAGDPDAVWDINVLGTRRALDAAVAAGARRFLHFSSVLAFSWTFPDGVDETHPVRMNGAPYVDTKVASEQVVLQAHAAGEIACTIVRPGDVWGPRSRPWTIIPVEEIHAGRFMLPRGGIFSPVYVDNLVDGVSAAAERDEAIGHVFTISDGVGVPNEEFFGHYFRMLGKDGPRLLPRRAMTALAWAGDRAARAAKRDSEINANAVAYLSRTGTYSIEKARRVLGYSPRVSLEQGMQVTERWLREEQML